MVFGGGGGTYVGFGFGGGGAYVVVGGTYVIFDGGGGTYVGFGFGGGDTYVVFGGCVVARGGAVVRVGMVVATGGGVTVAAVWLVFVTTRGGLFVACGACVPEGLHAVAIPTARIAVIMRARELLARHCGRDIDFPPMF